MSALRSRLLPGRRTRRYMLDSICASARSLRRLFSTHSTSPLGMLSSRTNCGGVARRTSLAGRSGSQYVSPSNGSEPLRSSAERRNIWGRIRRSGEESGGETGDDNSHGQAGHNFLSKGTPDIAELLVHLKILSMNTIAPRCPTRPAFPSRSRRNNSLESSKMHHTIGKRAQHNSASPQGWGRGVRSRR
jgi:hypothetical protein